MFTGFGNGGFLIFARTILVEFALQVRSQWMQVMKIALSWSLDERGEGE